MAVERIDRPGPDLGPYTPSMAQPDPDAGHGMERELALAGTGTDVGEADPAPDVRTDRSDIALDLQREIRQEIVAIAELTLEAHVGEARLDDEIGPDVTIESRRDHPGTSLIGTQCVSGHA